MRTQDLLRRTCTQLIKRAGRSSPSEPSTRRELLAGGAHANLFVNRLTHHRQDLIRDFNHVMHCGDVVSELGDHFLVAGSARFELTSRNESVALQDLG